MWRRYSKICTLEVSATSTTYLRPEPGLVSSREHLPLDWGLVSTVESRFGEGLNIYRVTNKPNEYNEVKG